MVFNQNQRQFCLCGGVKRCADGLVDGYADFNESVSNVVCRREKILEEWLELTNGVEIRIDSTCNETVINMKGNRYKIAK